MARADDVSKMKAHIRELVAQHGIKVRYIKGHEWGDREERTIAIKRVNGYVSYIVALHEIAHVVARLANYNYKLKGKELRKQMLRAEEEAWRWAISKSVVRVPHYIYGRISEYLNRYAGRVGFISEQEVGK